MRLCLGASSRLQLGSRIPRLPSPPSVLTAPPPRPLPLPPHLPILESQDAHRLLAQPLERPLERRSRSGEHGHVDPALPRLVLCERPHLPAKSLPEKLCCGLCRSEPERRAEATDRRIAVDADAEHALCTTAIVLEPFLTLERWDEAAVDRHARTADAEHLSAIPAVVASLHDPKLAIAAVAVGRLAVGDPRAQAASEGERGFEQREGGQARLCQGPSFD